KNPENKKLLEGVHQNAMKINNLIQEVMAFEKKEEHPGIGELLTSQLDLVSFAGRCLEEWKQMDAYRHIEFRFSSEIDSFLMQTDASKLESILNNLLSNACKYAAQTEAMVELALNRSDREISISFRDNGIGIPKKDLPYIFSKFYRATADEIQEIDGTGVGLYLVRNYCNQLGWTVELESEWQEGTTV